MRHCACAGLRVRRMRRSGAKGSRAAVKLRGRREARAQKRMRRSGVTARTSREAQGACARAAPAFFFPLFPFPPFLLSSEAKMAAEAERGRWARLEVRSRTFIYSCIRTPTRGSGLGGGGCGASVSSQRGAAVTARQFGARQDAPLHAGLGDGRQADDAAARAVPCHGQGQSWGGGGRSGQRGPTAAADPQPDPQAPACLTATPGTPDPPPPLSRTPRPTLAPQPAP